MISFSRSLAGRKLTAVMLLICLMFQVQAVFTCTLTGAEDSVDHCHDSVAEHRAGVEIESDVSDDPCCDFGAEVAFKDPASVSESVSAPRRPQSSPELPQLLPEVILAAFWPLLIEPPPPPDRFVLSIASLEPGRFTYLRTLRLRI